MSRHPVSTDADVIARIQALTPVQRQRFTAAVARIRAKHPTSAEWDQVDWHAILNKVEGMKDQTALSRESRLQEMAFEYWIVLHEHDPDAQQRITAWAAARRKAGLGVNCDEARAELRLTEH